MFWLILGKENDVYPLTATLSVNALDPHPPNVNLTLTMQWVGMDGFPKEEKFHLDWEEALLPWKMAIAQTLAPQTAIGRFAWQ